ncbi:uncharacterized protein Pyn_30817 [Prunus yedoensis var. nudiflora]|uniref:Uncharacterized protein n=1 Tax=Prunus yedoensis var. nudiflora TaxID=2094558 RepID=A0A314Z4M7_PRUYE|nr:uncharacterized protein Pyn_30817 [Prunus yedoensis var. nudiflora]
MTHTDEVDYVDLDGDTQDLEDIHVIDDISPTSTNGQKRRNRVSNSSDILHTKKRAAVKDVIADSIARMTLSFEVRADTKNLDPIEFCCRSSKSRGLPLFHLLVKSSSILGTVSSFNIQGLVRFTSWSI